MFSIPFILKLVGLATDSTQQNIKVALVVGHTEKGDKGAYSDALRTTEYDYWSDVAKRVQNLGKGVQIDIYDVYTHTIQEYYARQKALADKINNSGIKYDYVFELHFNAASPLANGSECLHYFNSVIGKKVAVSITNFWSKKFKTTVRGVNGSRALVNKNDRGFYFVYLVKFPAVILELFFGSNSTEALKFQDRDEVAQTLHQAILNLRKDVK